MAKLSAVIGVSGEAAAALADKLKGINIPWSTALEVFHDRTIPRYTKLTLQTYPGSAKLGPDALGALVSMTFNRGHALYSKDPKENLQFVHKRQIRDAIANGEYGEVPKLIRQSKVVWQNSKKNKRENMYRRRDREATFVEEGLARQKLQHR